MLYWHQNLASPLSKIEFIIKVSCLGKLPIIVSIPNWRHNGYSITYIVRFKLKLSSLPIDIEFFVN